MIECYNFYKDGPEVSCKHCCITMHLDCLPHKELYNSKVDYICPRHDQRAKQHTVSQNTASGYKPSTQFPRPMQVQPKPPFDANAHSVPFNARQKSVEEHTDKKEENKLNEEKSLEDKFYAESKEIAEEITNNLSKLVEQHGKISKSDKFKTDEEKDWNILDGKDLYSLSQGNIKKRIKKFNRQFKSKTKVSVIV